MKKILLILLGASMVGCASQSTIRSTYREEIYYRPNHVQYSNSCYQRYPRRFNRDDFAIQMAQSQIAASQMNQLIGGALGPNRISGVLLNYQNANRNINATMQNPWNGFFTARNYWQ